MAESRMARPATDRATIATLLLALGAPPLLAVAARHMVGDTSRIAALLPFDLLLWALFALVLTVVVRVERRPLASIGLRSPRLETVVWGLLLAAVTSFGVVPVAARAVEAAGLRGFGGGLEHLLGLPVGYRLFLAVTAGVVEEVLYRGYAVERLAALAGSDWLGGSLAAAAFGAAHIPVWGLGPALVALAGGIVMTLFYLWRRDLAANILAHALGDALGFVLLPPVGPGS